jgi:quercetin dioxygenase-like cupin family protein
MAKSFRRIVTTHNEKGESVVASDDTLTPELIDTGDAEFQVVWLTPTVPADLNAGTDGELETNRTLRGGSIMRIVDLVPGGQSPMHRTRSIDYGIVLWGTLELELDGGEVVTLGAGDSVVQRGTMHLWRNPTDKPCRIAIVLIESKPIEVCGRVLDEPNP